MPVEIADHLARRRRSLGQQHRTGSEERLHVDAGAAEPLPDRVRPSAFSSILGPVSSRGRVPEGVRVPLPLNILSLLGYAIRHVPVRYAAAAGRIPSGSADASVTSALPCCCCRPCRSCRLSIALIRHAPSSAMRSDPACACRPNGSVKNCPHRVQIQPPGRAEPQCDSLPVSAVSVAFIQRALHRRVLARMELRSSDTAPSPCVFAPADEPSLERRLLGAITPECRIAVQPCKPL